MRALEKVKTIITEGAKVELFYKKVSDNIYQDLGFEDAKAMKSKLA